MKWSFIPNIGQGLKIVALGNSFKTSCSPMNLVAKSIEGESAFTPAALKWISLNTFSFLAQA